MRGSSEGTCVTDRKWVLTLAAFVLTVVLQIGAAFWWASGISSNVLTMQRDIAEMKTITGQVQAQGQRLQAVESWVQEFRPLQIEFVRSVERLNNVSAALARLEARQDTQPRR